MDWSVDMQAVYHMLLATLTGGVIGLERQFSGHQAGIRTYAAVSLGSCLFGLISICMEDSPSRISAQVVSGLGFIGAGVIIRDSAGIKGLTTAATLWSTAAVGLAFGIGKLGLGLIGGLLIFGILLIHQLPWWKIMDKMRSTNQP